MDTTPWPQDIGLVKPMDQDHHLQLVAFCATTADATSTTTIINTSHMGGNTRSQLMERRGRPQKEQALNCPRCNSTNTKFCYYNNYSLSQPRYFCKTCRRYWTEGGSLRNVPVGGGSRKNKRSSSSSSTSSSPSTVTSIISSTSTAAAASMISLSSSSHQNPKFHEAQDINLAFPHSSLPREFAEYPKLASNTSSCCSTTSSAIPSSGSALSAMELLRNSARGMTPFMPLPVPETINYNSTGGFGLHDLRPTSTLNFPLDASNNTAVGNSSRSYGAMQENSSGRMFFPFEDLRQVSSNTSSTAAAASAAEEFQHSRPGQVIINNLLQGFGIK